MAHLIAASTNRVTYTPAVDLDTLTLDIATSSGAAVTYADTLTENASGNWTLDLTSTEITNAYLYDTLTFTWTLTYTSSGDTQVRTDVEYFDVVEQSVERIITVAEVKAHLGVTDDEDDEFISNLIDSAYDALDRAYELPTIPRTDEQRKFRCTNTLIITDELVSVDGVQDSSGNAITTYAIMYGRRPNDFYRGVLLDDSYDEYISVSGTWGYDDTPGDVKRAMLVTAATWYKRSKLGSDADVIGGFTMPREARELMEARRVLMA